jgi:hypothetical protein
MWRRSNCECCHVKKKVVTCAGSVGAIAVRVERPLALESSVTMVRIDFDIGYDSACAGGAGGVYVWCVAKVGLWCKGSRVLDRGPLEGEDCGYIGVT